MSYIIYTFHEILLDSGIKRHVVRWKSIYVSQENAASNFRVEE
jgi:hypothetical protein